MNYQEIKDLLSSGFTPDQITQLATISGVIPSAPDPTPENATAPAVESSAEVGEETPLPSPTEGENDNREPEADPLQEIRDQLQQLRTENKQLRDQLQTNNIRDRTVQIVSAPDAAQTLAEIIRPSFNKGGK